MAQQQQTQQPQSQTQQKPPQQLQHHPNLQQHPHLQQIQQQMLQQVQQAAAAGKPMPIGTQLLSKDGAVGVVIENNNVKVTYQPLLNRTGYLFKHENENVYQKN